MNVRYYSSLLLVAVSTCCALQISPLVNPVVEGDDVNRLPSSTALSCVLSETRLVATWTRAGEILERQPKYEILQNVSIFNATMHGSVLGIQMLSYTDAGNYTCAIKPSSSRGLKLHTTTIGLILLGKLHQLPGRGHLYIHNFGVHIITVCVCKFYRLICGLN